MLDLLQELLLLVHEVGRNGAHHLTSRAHGELSLDGAALFLGSRVRVYALLTHPVEELTWDLHECLLGEHVRVTLVVVEGDKLNDVSGHVLTVGLRVERFIVTIKSLHGIEIGIADANNNDSHGVVRTSDNLVNGLVHIANDTICHDHQNVELLVHLSDLRKGNIVVAFADDVGEVGRSVKLAAVKGSLVAISNFLDTVDTRIENIAIKSEAVRASVGVGRDGSAEAVEIDLFVAIIELQDIAYRLDGLKILVLLGVEVMERTRLPGVTI